MKLLGVDIVFNHADYRLMSKQALDALSQFEEVNLFYVELFRLLDLSLPLLNMKEMSALLENQNILSKMLAFAFDGITSFSIKPIRIITCLGALIFFISLIVLIVFYLLEIYRCYRQWMDFYRGLYLDDWRHPNALPWNYR